MLVLVAAALLSAVVARQASRPMTESARRPARPSSLCNPHSCRGMDRRPSALTGSAAARSGCLGELRGASASAAFAEPSLGSARPAPMSSRAATG
jgi:hypothetical protein